jgi:hypothetical protein
MPRSWRTIWQWPLDRARPPECVRALQDLGRTEELQSRVRECAISLRVRYAHIGRDRIGSRPFARTSN